jgi:hypothetical protein
VIRNSRPAERRREQKNPEDFDEDDQVGAEADSDDEPQQVQAAAKADEEEEEEEGGDRFFCLLPSCQFTAYKEVSMSCPDMDFCFMPGTSHRHKDDVGCTGTLF